MSLVQLPDQFSFTNAGGAKEDYALGPIDPLTDRVATEVNLALCAVAQSTRSIPRGYVKFTTAATTGALVLVSWDAVWKGATSTAPTLSRSSAGVFLVTFPATVSDEQGDATTHTVNIKGAVASNEDNFGFIRCKPSSANVITVRLADTTGTPADLVGSNIFVMFR